MITQRLASQVIIDILNAEMVMPPDSIWLRQQNKTIPNDNGLYIAVGLVTAQTVANVTQVQNLTKDPASGLSIAPTFYEVNQVQQQEAIQIDIFSSAASNAAMMRNWEVIAALQSIYSQQQQEANYFKIFRIPRSFVDSSSAEGGSMIQRYSLTIVCLVWYKKAKLLGNYYDDFTVAANDEKMPMLNFQENGAIRPLIEG